MDSNDNIPEFSESRYEFSVAEDAAAETVIGVIQASDPDSGSFGEILYSIKGFGSEKFSVREQTGEVRMMKHRCLFTPSLSHLFKNQYKKINHISQNKIFVGTFAIDSHGFKQKIKNP